MSRATVRHGLRQVEVALVAVPMSGRTEEISDVLGRLLGPADGSAGSQSPT